MAGIMYAIGVGPGDPELMTIKAARRLRECDAIAIPNISKEECTAYQIVMGAVPEIEKKECLMLSMPMTKEEEVLNKAHQEASNRVISYLDQGKNVAFITLGDVSIYSTGLYLLEHLKEKGYETVLESGIPSFCAVAARLNIPLVTKAEQLHIIPATYQIGDALKLPGVKVLMKTGKKMKEVKAQIKEFGGQAVMVENCGMPGEKVYFSLEEIPDDAGYYSLLIVK